MDAPVNNEKYEAILKTSHELFWKFGFRRVTIEEICREAKVSKMTFYRFFPNKPELTEVIIKNLFDNILKDYRKIIDQDTSFEEKVRQQLMMKFEGTADISPELVKDIYGDPDAHIFKYWKSRADEMMQIVFNDYAHAQKMGWIRKDMKLEFIFYFLNKTIEFASDKELQSKYSNMQALIMEIANFFFYGILSRNKTND